MLTWRMKKIVSCRTFIRYHHKIDITVFNIDDDINQSYFRQLALSWAKLDYSSMLFILHLICTVDSADQLMNKQHWQISGFRWECLKHQQIGIICLDQVWWAQWCGSHNDIWKSCNTFSFFVFAQIALSKLLYMYHAHFMQINSISPKHTLILHLSMLIVFSIDRTINASSTSSHKHWNKLWYLTNCYISPTIANKCKQ